MNASKSTPLSTMHINILILLSFGHLVTDLTAGALPVLLPVIQSSFNLSYSAAGVIPLLFNISSSVIQPLLGYRSDRVKSRWLLPLGCFLSMLGLALINIAPNYWFLLAVVLLSGLGSAAFHPEASKVSRLASGYRLTTGMSLFIVGGALGAALGSIITAWLLLHFDHQVGVYFMLPGLLMVILFWVFKNKLPEEPRLLSPVIGIPTLNLQTTNSNLKATPISVPVVEKNARVAKYLFPLTILILLIITRSWVKAGLIHFMPLYLVNHAGYSTAYAGSLIASFMLAGVAGILFGGPLADRFGRKTTLVVSTALLIPLMLILKFSTGITALILFFILGMVLLSTMATTIVIGQELMPHRVGVASGLMTGFAVGMGGLGALILGIIADNFGAPNALWVLTLLPIIALLLSLFLPEDKPKEK